MSHNLNLSYTPDQELVLSRTFDAPRELVYRAWTEAERLAKWWGPAGFAIEVAKLELRPGGLFHYSMTLPDGHQMWGKFVYLEIKAPERITFINCFSDPEGNITRAPFSATWPLDVYNVLTFVESAGKTTVTLRGGPVNATQEEVDTFVAGRASMQQGFGGTFDQLAAYLANA